MNTLLTPTELAYAAGIIDGEGSICISPAGGHDAGLALYVSVGNTDPRMPEWLKLRFGGHIVHRPSKNLKHKSSYCWQATSMLAARFLAKIVPYLVIKQERALLGMKFIAYRHERGTIKGSITTDTQAVENLLREEMQLLNKKGVTT